jgi:Gas vesicle protein
MSLPPDGRQVALVDLLDRVLATGVVVTGDVTISLADIDLIRLDLRVLLASVSSIDAARASKLTLGQHEHAILSPDGESSRSLPAPARETVSDS